MFRCAGEPAVHRNHNLYITSKAQIWLPRQPFKALIGVAVSISSTSTEVCAEEYKALFSFDRSSTFMHKARRCLYRTQPNLIQSLFQYRLAWNKTHVTHFHQLLSLQKSSLPNHPVTVNPSPSSAGRRACTALDQSHQLQVLNRPLSKSLLLKIAIHWVKLQRHSTLPRIARLPPKLDYQ